MSEVCEVMHKSVFERSQHFEESITLSAVDEDGLLRQELLFSVRYDHDYRPPYQVIAHQDGQAVVRTIEEDAQGMLLLDDELAAVLADLERQDWRIVQEISISQRQGLTIQGRLYVLHR